MGFAQRWSFVRPRHSSVESVLAWLVLSFSMLYALWTFAYHVATFANVPWYRLSQAAAVLGIPAWIIALTLSAPLADAYVGETVHTSQWRGFSDLRTLITVLGAAALIAICPSFNIRFLVCMAAIAAIWLFSEASPAPESIAVDSRAKAGWPTALILFSLIAIGLGVTLSAHRSDFDDAEYIQMALQTLQNPLRPPLTFDTSLGDFFSIFRFAPYRLDSYEMFVALVSAWTGANVLTTYYVIVPGITSVLTVATAYLFARWFLPNRIALLGTAVFLALMFAWGETHFAYGNRVFVRLYQGKGLLVALTTPLTILVGLIYLRRPRFVAWLALLCIQVTAIGVSSTGLVVTIIVTAILLVLCINTDHKMMLKKMAGICASATYPVICGLWLKYSHHGVHGTLAEIGTDVPINASLGNGLREGIVLALLVAGVASARMSKHTREFVLLIFGTLLLGLNPWLSEIIASLTARNMHWRIAWGAPIPLLIAIVLSANLALLSKSFTESTHFRFLSGALAAAVLCSFLFLAPSALSKANAVTWGRPGLTVPPEYEQSRVIAEVIKKLDISGRILASPAIGTWLTVTLPGARLVMPGHGYPMCWETVLPLAEFSDRTKLLDAAQGNSGDIRAISELARRYDVEIIVVPDNPAASRLANSLSLADDGFRYVDVGRVQGYAVYRRVHS